jgi:hypothetical protein
MKLSFPKEYISLLLDKISKLEQNATEQLFYEMYNNTDSPSNSHKKYEESQKDIVKLKQEILTIIDGCSKNG